MRSIKIAMCQIFSLDGDRSGNFIRIENALCEAKDVGVDIACFPETALLGWVNPGAHKRARPIPGEDSDKLCKLTKDYNLHLCVGLAEKQESSLYDSVILIDNKGNILLLILRAKESMRSIPNSEKSVCLFAPTRMTVKSSNVWQSRDRIYCSFHTDTPLLKTSGPATAKNLKKL